MFLASCTDFFLIKWIADLLGIIMNLLYNFFEMFDITNIGLCIIVFTIVVKMIMFPLTLKQQKFTKLSSVMNPELQAIQKKYKGKNDQDSMLRMQEETKAVYAKYGVSQTGGCLNLLIQMPIIFALYAVISLIPNYVGDVKDIYINNNNSGVIDVIYDDQQVINDMEDVYKLVIDYNAKKDTEGFSYEFTAIDKYFGSYDFSTATDDSKVKALKEKIYNSLIGVNTSEANWKQIANVYANALAIADKLAEVTNEEWEALLNKETEQRNINLINKYRTYDYAAAKTDLNDGLAKINSGEDKISEIYNFFTIDLSKSPKNGTVIALLIPLLSALTQWFSMKISTSTQAAPSADNPMASSMKVMNIMMPLMSAFFCYSLPSGLGLYWVITAVVQIVQQVGINMYFKKIDVDTLVKQNMEKAAKEREKKGIPANSISNAASTNTKGISYNANKEVNSDVTSAPVSTAKKGSIASKANMVREFNERNNK